MTSIPTICHLITILYANADRNESDMDKDILEQVYIMAKKMDRRLREYKGELIDIMQDEEYWIIELRSSLLSIKAGKYTI